MFEEQGHDPVFHRGELDLPLSLFQGAGIEIQRQILMFKKMRPLLRVPGGTVIAAEVRAYAGHGLQRIKGLDHVIVRAEIQAQDLLRIRVLRGNDDHRDVADLPELLQDVEPVQLRHHDIEEAQGNIPLRHHLKRFLAVAGLRHLVAFIFQIQFQERADLFFVVRDQDSVHVPPP